MLLQTYRISDIFGTPVSIVGLGVGIRFLLKHPHENGMSKNCLHAALSTTKQ